MVVAKVRERVAVIKQRLDRFVYGEAETQKVK
jgi:hypothetical protein